ncbi:hypothetical protein GYMLUDRAFT_99213 [Collybiopsis luxurians FD-317 M1]|uniref:Uncharacterized protein n=1 Tax=Collybiopsis luxurians FD-317 M1 TaxID=944289 RepID=A0A0D0CMF1_9AGAR|nr:hypothetical protein GYMLUDRAFT_99213 [Collybiopsis luxurians FD-317 M1]
MPFRHEFSSSQLNADIHSSDTENTEVNEIGQANRGGANPNRNGTTNSNANTYILTLFEDPNCHGPVRFGQIISGFVSGTERHDMPQGHHLRCVQAVTDFNQPCNVTIIPPLPGGRPLLQDGWRRGVYRLGTAANGIEVTCAARRRGSTS